MREFDPAREYKLKHAKTVYKKEPGSISQVEVLTNQKYNIVKEHEVVQKSIKLCKRA